MQAIHAENVSWKSKERGVREAKIFSTFHGSEETRIDFVEVPAGAYIPAHRHSARREFITILQSAGAQLQIGERIFRPVAGQVFHREPGDVLALTNDSQHPFRYSVVRFGYESSDIEVLQHFEDPELPFMEVEEPEPISPALEATVEMDAVVVEENSVEVSVEDDPEASVEVSSEGSPGQEQEPQTKSSRSKASGKSSKGTKSARKPKSK